MGYYDTNADEFYNNTVSVDMQPLYSAFLKELPKNASVVDAGCGSGRDSKFFLSKGFEVIAFDQSKVLSQKACELTGLNVLTESFLSMKISEQSQDAIWACASLLHVSFDDLPKTFDHMANWLKPGGVFYCSFKYGDSEKQRVERLFTDMNEARLHKVIKETGLNIKSTWITDDRRKGREDAHWLNALLIK